MILVVDDEDLVSGIYCDFLQLEGYDVVVANSVSSARDKLAQYKFDLVITDYKMPSEDGLALIRYLNSEFPQTKVVMITGFPEGDATNEAFRQGIVEFLYKPVECEELLLTVKKLLGSGSSLLLDHEELSVDEILNGFDDAN